MKTELKVAIVTGGGGGIGKACVHRFVQEGIRVVLGDISQSDGDATLEWVKQQKGKALFVGGDIAEESVCDTLAQMALEQWGRIDILVANAAHRNFSKITEATSEEWDRMLAVNLKGTAQTCKAVLPTMIAQQSGSIVLLSSVHAKLGRAEMPIYDVTKAGIVSLTKTLATEHGKDGIRVNAVCPGFTITDYHTRKAQKASRNVDDLWKTKVGVLGRPAAPSELASAIYFLASDEASYVTGHALMVDGGMSI